MKNSRILSVAFLVSAFFFLLGCSPQPRDVTSEISKANDRFMKSFNSGDAAGVAACYTKDAKLFPPNSDIIQGRKAIENFWNGGMQMGIEVAKLETTVAKSYGNFALEEGIYKLYGPENVLIDHGKYLVTWNKIDGQWQLSRDIWNTSTKHVARDN
ncbi:MAG: DUF4440 domain-containing protein [Bacteroidales bacterium]|nr:DUF4440 domain-containing protein [Bacteroidales bacterium]